MSRPHWMPTVVWIGIEIGKWPLQAFSGETEYHAMRWAAGDPDKRRIFCVAVPEDTVVHKAETVPATVKMTQVTP